MQHNINLYLNLFNYISFFNPFFYKYYKLLISNLNYFKEVRLLNYRNKKEIKIYWIGFRITCYFDISCVIALIDVSTTSGLDLFSMAVFRSENSLLVS